MAPIKKEKVVNKKLEKKVRTGGGGIQLSLTDMKMRMERKKKMKELKNMKREVISPVKQVKTYPCIPMINW